MGLLDMQGQAGAPPQGGLLGQYQGAAQQAQGGGGGNAGLEMAMQLAQNPTPQMAQQIVEQMRKAGMPEADQIAEAFQQAGSDQTALKQIAEAVIAELSK